MRSIQKALRDSAGLVEQFAIKREELACVRVDSFGGGMIQIIETLTWKHRHSEVGDRPANRENIFTKTKVAI